MIALMFNKLWKEDRFYSDYAETREIGKRLIPAERD
jgi:hypothetical protein